MNLGLLLIAVIGYLIGCIPTAWIALKLRAGKDIRSEGTGNVGAHNTFDVTGSKALAIIVGVVDALKGVAAVLVARAIHGEWFAATAVAGTFVVLGHCYNAFLGFKGGRGLATATGVFAVVAPFFILLWDITYLTGYYVIRRHVHVGAMTATIATAALAWSTPDRVITLTSLVDLYEPMQMRLFIAATCFVIFLRHVEPIRELLRASSEQDADDEE
jgi:glycerol-3-phosphate acyltransferase PlsY